MNPISFKRHRFPPAVISYAVWLYFRVTLSIRNVEELLAQRGIEASREAVRRRRRSAAQGRGRRLEIHGLASAQ
jgi:transposase-like protein